MIIRKIEAKDNRAIQEIIQNTILEFGLPSEGTAFEDPETLQMFEAYQGTREAYFVIEVDGAVLGGGGIKALKNEAETICELQKMYFKPNLRGNGYGKLMIDKCLETAKSLGYDTCYLESDSKMKAAIHLYEKYGFNHLTSHLGGTGHYSCGVWMTKSL